MGSTYRSEQVFVGKPQTADIEIVEFDRPNRFAFAITQRKQGSTTTRPSTEDLRQGLVHYRALFTELLEADEGQPTQDRATG